MKTFILFLLCGFTSFAQTSEALFSKLDLNNPNLSKVKKAYDKNNLEQAKKALLNAYRKQENIYLSVSDSDLDYIKSTFPEEVTTSITVADEVIRQYFLFRYEWDMEKTIVPYVFEKEIDWLINPFGDPEWTFMLNRHRFWLDLGKAYMLTKNEIYAKTFVDQALHWIENIKLFDSKAKQAWRLIEAGIRMENWIKSFELVKHSDHVTASFLETFLMSIEEHAVFLNSDFNTHSQISNWGVIEYNGLFSAGIFMSYFKDAKTWQDSALEKLNICINNQILNDGTQWEQSPMYHNEVMHCFMNTLILANRANIKPSNNFITKVKQMAYANIEWQKPNYNEPLLGDSDDNDLRDMLTTAAFLFNDGTIKSRAYPSFNYENYFLFGKAANTTYKAIASKTPNFLSAYQFNAGDLYSRSSWGEDAFYSHFHTRRIGGGHSHDDLLHFDLFAYGKDYLVDTGRYTYMYNEWRQYFKENTAHNTLGVDNLTNSIYNGSWSNKFEAKSEGAYALIKDNFDYAEAINKAYFRLNDPVLLKRRVLYLKPDVWLIVDAFEAKEEHVYSQYFNFAHTKVNVEDGGLITTLEKDNLRIQPLNPVQINLKEAWYSPDYNYKETITRAELSNKTKGFNSFISVVYFPEHNTVNFEKVPVYNRRHEVLPDNEVEAVRLRFRDKEYIVVVSHVSSNKLYPHTIVEDNIVVSGEVVLISRENGKQDITVLK